METIDLTGGEVAPSRLSGGGGALFTGGGELGGGGVLHRMLDISSEIYFVGILEGTDGGVDGAYPLEFS